MGFHPANSLKARLPGSDEGAGDSPMAASEIEEQLRSLDSKLDQLKREYGQYFLGSRAREPVMLRSDPTVGKPHEHTKIPEFSEIQGA